MRSFLPTLLLVALAGAPALAQGTLGDASLETDVNGSGFSPADKPVSGGDALSIRVQSPNNVGNPVVIAGDLVPCGFPVCVDFDGSGNCDLNLGINVFFIVDGTGLILPSGLPAAMGPNGFTVAGIVPGDGSLFGAPDDEALRLQAAVHDPSEPILWATTDYIDHPVESFTEVLSLGDDTSEQVDLGNGFPFYGVTHTEVFVGSNGFLTFNSGDGDFTPSQSEFLNEEPRIAPCWSDLSPNVAGTVQTTLVRNCGGDLVSLAVDFVDLPAFGAASDVSTFSVVLHGSGDVDMAWGSLNPSAQDDIVGISPGGGLSTAAEVDLSQVGPLAGGSNEAIFELGEETGCGDTVRDLAGGVATFAYDGVDAYTYDGGAGFQATVSGFSPASGDDTGGQTVTFDGVNLSSAAVYDVEFDGLSVPATFVDACTLTAVTPAHAPGAVDVEVFCDGASIALFPGGYTYVPAGTFTGLLTPGGDGSSVYTFQSTSDGDFDFYGTAYTEVWVNGNGNLTFGSGDSDFSESAAEMLSDQPRIAAFWDDIEVQNGPDGGVSYVEDATTATFDYGMEPHFSGSFTGTASCVVTLDKATGLITLAYGTNGLFNGSPDASNCIAGISPGGGLGTQNALDLNGPTASGTALDAIFQYLNDVDGPWDLDAFSVGLAPDLAGTAYTVN